MFNIEKFKTEYNRINSVILGASPSWKNNATIGHIYNEAVEYYELILSHFENNPINFLEIGVLKGGNFTLTGNLLNTAFALGVDNGSCMLQKEFNSIVSTKALQPCFPYDILLGDSYSEEMLKRVKGKNITFDLIYIDGDHSYNGCKKDFEMYSPLINKGGIIVFHDINPTKNSHIRVSQFWQEIKKQYKYKEIVDKNKPVGIGVLFL